MLATDERALGVAAGRGYLLAGLGGEAPAAPAWFRASLAVAPERRFIPVNGVQIETLSWGSRGLPGLILLHGQGACADWWSFIAPFFASDFRVTAISWAGMGRSGWRDAYQLGAYAQDMFAVALECGIYDAPCRPLAVAHSFGGMPLLFAAAHKGSALKGAVLVDSYVPGTNRKAPASLPRNPDKIRSFSTLREALARFRLLPQQECDNLFLVDYIARHSLLQQPLSPEVPEGWRWRVDPDIRRKTVGDEVARYLSQVACPVALLRGARSSLCTAEYQRKVLSLAPNGTPSLTIPDAAHHVMLDQPLALIAGLQGLFAGWPCP